MFLFFLSKDNAIEALFIISQRIPNSKRYSCLTKVGSIKAIFRMKKDTGIFRLQYSAFKLFTYNCIHDLTSSLCPVTSPEAEVISSHNGGHDKAWLP